MENRVNKKLNINKHFRIIKFETHTFFGVIIKILK